MINLRGNTPNGGDITLKLQIPYCPVYKPRLSDANLGSENIPRPIHRGRNVDH